MGSQACVPRPRAMRPLLHGAGSRRRAAGRPSPPASGPRVGTTRSRPAPPAWWGRRGPAGPPARAPRRGAGRGRRPGSAERRCFALSARTEQPVSTTRSAGLAAFSRAQDAHAADDLLLRGLADGAGVDDDEVGLLEPAASGAAGRQERARHLLRVGRVHLAAQRPDVEAGQEPLLGGELSRAVRRPSSRSRRGRHRRRAVEDRQAEARAHATPRAACRRSPASGGTCRPAWALA